MWETLTKSPRLRVDLGPQTNELLESTFKTLVWSTAAICVLWQFMAVILLPDEQLVLIVFINAALIIDCIVALLLLKFRFLIAEIAWLVGLGAIITISILFLHLPTFSLFYAILPMIATVTIHHWAGLGMEIAIALLVWWILPSSKTISFPALRIIIVISGLLSWLLSWLVTRSLIGFANWCLDSYEHARDLCEDALDQRLELKQAQEDLVMANQELARLSERLKATQSVIQEARQAKEEFVANVSHELRTPLNMIIGFSEMIPKLSQVYGTELPPALLSDIAAIHRNSQHLSEMVDDVLDLSRIEAGHMVLHRERTLLQKVVEEAVLAVQALFESKDLYLEMNVPPDLPPLSCDITRIRQVLLNLLSNAARFTEQGGVKIGIEQTKTEIVVSVSDTGPGIADKDLERLFEPFQQLDNSIRRRHGGTGLGLSISRRFVEMHGGRLWAESEAGQGTTFYFGLPMDGSLLPVPPQSLNRWFNPYQEYQTRTRPSRASVPDPNPRFVLVERGKTLQHLFSRYQQDFEIAAVQDIKEAIEELRDSPAKALIVNSPSYNDTSAYTEHLGGLPYSVPTISCWVPGEEEAADQLGVVRYLLKPITCDTLLSTLDDLGQEIESVLLVDDEPEMLRLFTRMLALSPKGYRILQTTSGQRAISLLRDRQPDLLFLDLIMPKMDGFQVLQSKRLDPTISHIPTIVCSARDPSGEPVVSNGMVVSQNGGLAVRELLTCIHAIGDILSPSLRPARQAQQADDSTQPEMSPA